MEVNDVLDLRTLKCPLPALLAQKALAKVAPGAVVTVLADDPLAAVDIPHMCHHEGHGVEAVTEQDGYRSFVLRRGAGRAAAAPGD